MGGEMPEAEGKASSTSASAAAASSLPPSAPPLPQHQQYGAFQPPRSSGDIRQAPIGFPQPSPPAGLGYHQQQPQAHPYAPAAPYYAQGYQAVQGIPVVEGRPVRLRRLPCCGLGMGWLLFIMGFFLAAIPWYIGAFVLICVRVHDYREKPGYVACTVAAAIAAISIILGVTKGTHVW